MTASKSPSIEPTTKPTVDDTESPTESMSVSTPPSMEMNSKPTVEGTCSGDLTYYACGPVCEVTCNSRDDHVPIVNGQPCSTCTLPSCPSGCFCPPDKPIRVDGTDICLRHPNDCPPKTTSCKGYMVLQECGNTCPPTCDNAIPLPQDGGIPCIYPNFCSVGCFCPPDKPIALGDGSGTCVADRSECPSPAPIDPGSPTMAPTSEVTYAGTFCPGDLVFITCGGNCPRPTCNNRDPPKECSEECIISSCFCPTGKPLQIDRTDIECVEDFSQCPPPELQGRSGFDDEKEQSPKRKPGEGIVQERTYPYYYYDPKSSLRVTFFEGTGEELLPVEAELLLREFEIFLQQWLTNPDQTVGLALSKVDLIYSSYQYDEMDAPDEVEIDFETMVGIPPETMIRSERQVMNLLTQANFRHFIGAHPRRNPGVGIFENTFKVLFKVIGTNGV
jgi:hypothetical protein